MNKNVLAILIVSIIIGAVMMMMYFQDNDYRWYEDYSSNHDEPYTLSVLTEVLDEDELYVERQSIGGMLSNTLDSNSLYFYIKENYYLNDSAQMKDLFSSVSKGTNAIISTRNFESRSDWDYDEDYNWTSINRWTILDSFGLYMNDS